MTDIPNDNNSGKDRDEAQSNEREASWQPTTDAGSAKDLPKELPVMRHRDDPPVLHHDGPDRHLPLLRGPAGGREGEVERRGVIHRYAALRAS